MMYSVHVCLVAEEERWVVDGLFFLNYHWNAGGFILFG